MIGVVVIFPLMGLKTDDVADSSELLLPWLYQNQQ